MLKIRMGLTSLILFLAALVPVVIAGIVNKG